MFPSAYLLLLLAQPVGRAPGAQIVVSPGVQSLDLSWSDAEDRLQGSVRPRAPIEGAPLEVTAHVGTFQGVEFEGPVTFSLKPASSSVGGHQSQTVQRAPGEKAWRVGFVPERPGLHTLEISFSTTRLKVASAGIPVEEGRLPRWPWWTLVGVAGAIALGLGVRSVFRKQENM